ncbi:MAG: hypothetical protein WD425_06040 [Nitrospirales bacterium]
MRILAILLAAINVVGCAQTERSNTGTSPSKITTTQPDCSLYPRSYNLNDSVLLLGRASDAVRDLHIYTMRANFKDSEERRKAEKNAQSKADEAIKKLDDVERRAEEEKASAGKCFGKGDDGKSKRMAEQYARIMKMIAEQRTVVTKELKEMLARNKAVEEERTNWELWREDNRARLVSHVGGMKLEIVRIAIAIRDILGRPASITSVTVEATNTTTSRILKPRNQRFLGDVRLSIGASLTDSFGNDYRLEFISPNFLGIEARGIRPGQTVTFELRFGDVPLQNAESVRLSIAPGTLGQEGGTMFELPSEAFYGSTVKR